MSIPLEIKLVQNKVGYGVYTLIMDRVQNNQYLSETDAAKEIASMIGISHQTTKKHWNKWKIENLDDYKLLKKNMRELKK